jgi:hypothetical protein
MLLQGLRLKEVIALNCDDVTRAEAQITHYAPKAPQPEPPQIQPPPASPAEDPEVVAIKAALAERQQKEAQHWADTHAMQLWRREFDLTCQRR